MNDHITVTHGPLKATTALAAGMLGHLDLSDVASLLAIVYTLILIGEWIYKRFFKKSISQDSEQ